MKYYVYVIGDIDFPESLPPLTLESAGANIEKASRVLERAINVFYREKGRAVPQKLLNTLAACENVLGRSDRVSFQDR